MATATTSAPQQQVPAPALDLRRMIGATISAKGVTTSADLLVAQHAGGANMSVDVAAGSALIKDDHGSGGGYYCATWTATDNVVIAASDPTNPRIDRVYIRVRDAFLGDAANDITLVALTGTPTAGATLANTTGAGVVPNSCLLLANVLVPATATTIVTANIDTTGASNNSPAVRPMLVANAIPSVQAGVTASSQSIPNNASTQILLTTFQWQLGGATVAANALTVPAVGIYLVTADMQWASTAGTLRTIELRRKNAAGSTQDSILDTRAPISNSHATSTVLRAVMGDTFVGFVTQDSGGALLASPIHMTMTKIG